MKFQNKDCAINHIEQLQKHGRRNILLSDDLSRLRRNNLINGIAFTVNDGFLIPYSNMGEIMPMSELSQLIDYLITTLENFDEDKSIKEEIEETYNFINKKPEKKVYEKNIKIGYVYLILGENDRYKIGYSKNPDRRLAELKLSSCENHTLIHKFKINNPMIEEQRLHKLFDKKRVHSEWFDLLAEDVEYIKGLSDEV